jgi:hypothetical protein
MSARIGIGGPSLGEQWHNAQTMWVMTRSPQVTTLTGMTFLAQQTGTPMSREPPEEPTQHGETIDRAVPSQRMPSQQESASLAADSDSDSEEEQDDEPDWYPPPDVACM